MKDGQVTSVDWMRSVGTGMLAGAAFVALAMLVENKAIKAGSRLFGK